MENRDRFGFRDDDELIAVIVVLLLVAILAFYFIRGFGRQNAVVENTEAPIAVVETEVAGSDDSAELELDADAPAIAVEPNAEADISGAAINADTPDATSSAGAAATAAITPTLALQTDQFPFGAVLISGIGQPNTDVDIEISNVVAGTARVNDEGSFDFTIPAGSLGVGSHTAVAIANDLRSAPQDFTLRAPEAPSLAANWNNAVAPPSDDTGYQVFGQATPNWFVAVGVADSATPQLIPTDASGAFTATVKLDTVGVYDLEVFAVNPDQTVNFDASTGKNRIYITADGQPPADLAAAPSEDAGEAGVEPDEGSEEVDAAATAEADAANAAATAEADAAAAAQAEADAAATTEAQAAADASATTEAETAAQATVEAEAAAAAAATAEAEQAASTTLYQQLLATGQHNTLIAAVDAAGLRETLEQPDQALTLFAPTDAAFGKLPAGIVDQLVANPDALRGVLVEHVVAGQIESGLISAETTSVTNLADHVVSVAVENESILIGGSTVTQADILASNGVIHAIDGVILPPSDYVKPVIDTRGVPIFKGNFLIVVGTAQTGSNLILTLNDVEFGQQIVGDDGSFEISGDITDGDYTLVAYSVGPDGILRSISDPVRLIVDNS